MIVGPIDEVAVVVPARDEQAGIAACLAAIAVAAAELTRSAPGRPVRVRTIVVLDDCRDGTAAVVARTAGVEAVVVGDRCVGAARAAGTARALATAGVAPHALWTAHTDADSRVPADWLTTMLAAADAGADAVLGTVVPDAKLDVVVRAAWTRENPAVEDHPYVHGANLGVRASTYLAVGGWRPLATGEDVDLVARLVAARATVVRTAVAPVTTDSRRVARAPLGFAHHLGELDIGA